jgi:putative FmdB family regulatory protein
MPLYEYQATSPDRSCAHCRDRFEELQAINDDHLRHCPKCNNPVRRIISWCHGAVVSPSEEDVRVTQTVHDYERAGMWSHAAELADKHSEKSGDSSMKHRALDDYKKAGYDTDTLNRHASKT